MKAAISLLSSSTKAAALSGLLALLGVEVPADTRDTDSYTWSAQLVAFDEDSNTVTVKARVVEPQSSASIAALTAGDQAVLTWSGLSTAAGIRALERGSKSSFDRMTMPVEYVASELDGQYIVFKVEIPESDVAAIGRLTPGQYVRATSPLQADSASEAVSSIRPYNDVE